MSTIFLIMMMMVVVEMMMMMTTMSTMMIQSAFRNFARADEGKKGEARKWCTIKRTKTKRI